ncbi:hypothetical protein [Amycolatopsis sp. PS_44_ISF1]|uniref:hypothetical protein n=1 Tax=Amycolatopsis sp. PS_44_ISF1 TaxID=2974917 RepID=UPI0028DED363|nr:hypothetical protein [Amycolatopsis sp. PS_44_ISF1]MDT8910922.1 hypothetical protein [Amycolatopsis sp. PS_44_ISF1]
MVSKDPRTRLEQLARARHLSLADFLREFPRQAKGAGEGNSVHVSERQAKRWFRGGAPVPRSVSCRVLEFWFGEPVKHLLGPPKFEVAGHAITEEELLVSTARESSEHALDASSALDPSALENLVAMADRAAVEYYTTPSGEMLTDLVRLRNTVYEQLDRTNKPRQKAELYLIAGQVCGLLASVTWDLGRPHVSEEQARAAHTYGSVIDHRSLQAWARALQVTVAFWDGRPRQAIAIADTALETAPSGTARARLHSVKARALALRGARQEVQQELAKAAEELDRAGGDTFLDEVGGELGFDRSRRALCAGAAFVTLGDGDQAEIEALDALVLFAERPELSRWGAGESGARIDLGAARVLRGDLAGAEEALRPVLDLDSSRRTEAISLRMQKLRAMLSTARYRGAGEALQLGDEIEDFTAHSLSRTSTVRLITDVQ